MNKKLFPKINKMRENKIKEKKRKQERSCSGKIKNIYLK